jgi:hypothetical protein
MSRFSEQVGMRVGAVMSADPNTVHLFGYGVFNGDKEFDPELGIRVFGAVPPEGLTNPEILLDSGEKVYGCECWWGPEDDVKGSIGDREVVIVSPKAERERHAAKAVDAE